MLQAEKQILLIYESQSRAFAKLKLSNPHPNMVISYKIKTTTPSLFSVSPNKSNIGAGSVQQIHIQVVGEHTQQEINNISIKQKFQVQQQQLEQKWVNLSKTGNIKNHKFKLKFQFQGVKASDLIFQQENKGNQRQTIYQSIQTRTQTNVINQQKKQQKANVPIIQPLPQRYQQDKRKLIKTAFLLTILIVALLYLRSSLTSKFVKPSVSISSKQQHAKQTIINQQ